jgi:hypothetical protein
LFTSIAACDYYEHFLICDLVQGDFIKSHQLIEATLKSPKLLRNGYCRSRGLPMPYPNTRKQNEEDTKLNKLDEETISLIPVAYYMMNTSGSYENGQKIVFRRQLLQKEGNRKSDYVLRACMDHGEAMCHFCQQTYVAPEEEFGATASFSKRLRDLNHIPNHCELRCLPCKHVFHVGPVFPMLREAHRLFLMSLSRHIAWTNG